MWLVVTVGSPCALNIASAQSRMRWRVSRAMVLFSCPRWLLVWGPGQLIVSFPFMGRVGQLVSFLLKRKVGLAPSPSRGRLGWGWVEFELEFGVGGGVVGGETHPHPNPPLEGEGFRAGL